MKVLAADDAVFHETTPDQPVCQRWRNHRSSYRPAREPIDPSKFGVEPIERDRDARAFVVAHHYSASYPAARFRAGLFRQAHRFAKRELVGVAVFSVPAQSRAIPCWLEVPGPEGVELGRFVLLDDVRSNAETWFLARALRQLREELPEVRRVLSYSDPAERVVDGVVVKRGHVGTIYRAANASHLGRSKVETEQVSPRGVVVSRRALSKIRNDERGAGAAVRRLVALGGPERQAHEPGRLYVERALREGGFRPHRHPGKHVFAFGLYRGERRAVRRLAEVA